MKMKDVFEKQLIWNLDFSDSISLYEIYFKCNWILVMIIIGYFVNYKNQ